MNIPKSLLFVSILVASVSLLTSCKKKPSKKLTTVEFHMYNPVTGEVFAGVKVGVSQEQQKSNGPFVLGDKYVKTTLWEGVTDENGKASYSFYAYSDNKYQYWPLVDESFMNSYNILTQPAYDYLNKDADNKLVWQVTKKVSFIRWIKNVNYFDVNDKFSYRIKEIGFPNKQWGLWIPYGDQTDTPTSFIEGDVEIMSSIITEGQNIYEVEMVTIRNGVTTTKKDTFYLNGVIPVDTMKIFY